MADRAGAGRFQKIAAAQLKAIQDKLDALQADVYEALENAMGRPTYGRFAGDVQGIVFSCAQVFPPEQDVNEVLPGFLTADFQIECGNGEREEMILYFNEDGFAALVDGCTKALEAFRASKVNDDPKYFGPAASADSP